MTSPDNIEKEFSQKTAQTPKIDDMCHIAIMNAPLDQARKFLKPFEPPFPSGALIQPTTEGITFFHVNILHANGPVRDTEMPAFRNIHQSTPLDACVLLGGNTQEQLQHSLARVKIMQDPQNGFAQDVPIFLVSTNPEETIELLDKTEDGNLIDQNNIIPWKNCDNEFFLNRITKQPAPFEGTYGNADCLRTQYKETKGIKKAQAIMSEQYESSQKQLLKLPSKADHLQA